MSRTRVVLADDQAQVLEAVRRLLEAEFDVVGAVASGERLLQAVDSLHPDLVVIDISMPGLSGLEAARRLVKSGPAAPRVVFLTVYQSPAIVREALACGARGYVLKVRADTELVSALHEVVAGRSYVSPSLGLDGSGSGA